MNSQIVDLHLHTTASDGRCDPRDLVRRAEARGIRALAVTDHDTMAGLPDAASEASERGLAFLSGIEITAVFDGRDVHVLSYGLSDQVPGLMELLADHRARRVCRAREIAERLARLGAPVDTEMLLASASKAGGKSLARPQIARALVDAGHVVSIAEAFERFLGEHCAAYVPHQGASPHEVVSLIVQNGGVASLAHPGQLKRDELIPGLVDVGMTCLEVYHSAHGPEEVDRYRNLASRYGLLATGGSDYHGEGTRRAEYFGVVGLPEADFEKLMAHLEDRANSATAG